MGKFLFLCAVSFILVVVVLMHTAAEREYFTVPGKLTWDEARNHCQICFKELVTLTPQNIQIIIQRLNSDHWIGLRKNSNSTSNTTRNSTSNTTSMSWTQWADGGPLTFQNWYPGWPVFKSPLPKIECCSCSCTCPSKMTTAQTLSPTTLTDKNVTGFWDSTTENMTAYSYSDATDLPWVTTPVMPVEAACERSPMQSPVVLETNEKYIEDSCVAMLTFGPWVERSCLERLAFICYEDRFVGEIIVTKLTLESASLAWQRGPDGISHYRIEVKGEGIGLKENLTDLTYDLGNLTSGTLYSVQLFPVKCERDLYPQSTTFYTLPDKVKGLKVIKVTETNVSLSWNKPNGNWDIYRVKYQDGQTDVKTEGIEVENLIPGGCYTFSIFTGVQQKSNWSEESSIAACTRPGKVSVTVSKNTNVSLLLSWTKPKGNFTGFRVMALDHSNAKLINVTVDKDEFSKLVTGLPNGSKIHLFVTVLANHTLEGDNETIISYTAPGPISNLTVETKHNSLTATWNPPTGDNLQYIVELWLDQKRLKTENPTDTKLTFDELTTGSNYTVVVFAVSGDFKSPEVKRSEFTLPSPPTGLSAIPETNSITLVWNSPPNVIEATYLVKINSTFWNQSQSKEVFNKTSVKFDDLKSGSKYQFEVQTMAGERKSIPANYNKSTAADTMEISLSMMCSTADADACDPQNARTYVNEQLEELFKDLLGDMVFWELKK